MRKSLARNRKTYTGVAATKLLLKPMLGLCHTGGVVITQTLFSFTLLLATLGFGIDAGLRCAPLCNSSSHLPLLAVPVS